VRRFTHLFQELDRTTRTNAKVAALEAYFRDAPAADAAWALYFLTGRRIKRAVTGTRLREWAAEATGLPLWLVEESYAAVGDLAETLALLLPPGHGPTDTPLHELVEECIAPLPDLGDEESRELVTSTWTRLDEAQRLVWHKLITGAFRVGVGKKLVVRALAGVTGMERAVMAHRLTGSWEPTPDDYRRITDPDAELVDPGQPYPFFLAHPLEDEPETLGERDGWQAEWKWDGIRAQLLRRKGLVLIWSRGEDLITHQFPEVETVGQILPEGTALDGEIVAWADDGPLPFGSLQKRLGRKRVGPKLLEEVPALFMAYDLLEAEGEDLRSLPLTGRRARLEAVVASARERGGSALPLRPSPTVDAPSWEALARLREEARERGVEGLMLKRRDSAYRVGRPRGPWWKWKVEPFRVDAVMMYAQRGHGRRASLYSDYTFGVWDGGELVPIAKAYSGLTDAEIRRVDRWVRQNIRERFGPVRAVPAEQVFELAFDGIRRSNRHKSGVALRFPRMARWREDKPAEEADSVETVRALLRIGRSKASS
jgi:DNA ligase-1